MRSLASLHRMVVMDAAATWSASFAGVAVLLSLLGLVASGWNASRWSKASKRADDAEERADKAEKRADAAEERAKATEKRAEEAHALAKAADARADRIESRETESRDVRWDATYDPSKMRLHVRNIGQDEARKVSVRLDRTDTRGWDTEIGTAELVPGNHGSVPMDVRDWVTDADARYHDSLERGLFADGAVDMNIHIKWESPSGVPDSVVIEGYRCL